LGVGLPSLDDLAKSSSGLQEERLGREAWQGILKALKKIKARHEAEQGNKMEE
jgi:hypothetical protein